MPKESEMGAFWWLFLERTQQELVRNNIFTKLSGDEEQEVIDKFLNSKPKYNGLNDMFKEFGFNDISR